MEEKKVLLRRAVKRQTDIMVQVKAAFMVIACYSVMKRSVCCPIKVLNADVFYVIQDASISRRNF